MSQTRTHDYASDLSSEAQNRKLARIIPPGVYEGMQVAVNGTIAPGMLYTADGVRIEESGNVLPRWGSSWENMGVPPGDPTYPRRDLIVCQYLWEASVPPPQATYKVIAGVPAAAPEYPDIPENSIVLARALMPTGGTVYSEVLQAGPPDRLVNCTLNADGTHSVIKGALAAMRMTFDVNTGIYAVYKRPAGTYADGGVIDWEDPLFSLDDTGIMQLKMFADALAATTPSPGSSMLGVKAKTGANALLSIASGDLQTALEKLITDGDAGLKALGDLISGHVNIATDAHTASAISLLDSVDQFAAANVEAALAEVMSGFAKEHILPASDADSKHKTLHWADPVLGAPRLLADAGGGMSVSHYRQYFDGVSLWLVVNAYMDAANSNKWTLDRSNMPALAVFIKPATSQMHMARKASGSAPWTDSDWDKQIDMQAALIALNQDVEIDGDMDCTTANVTTLNATDVNATSLRGASVELGTGGPKILKGVGAPSDSPGVVAPVGSLYIKTDTGKLYQKTGSGDMDWTERT